MSEWITNKKAVINKKNKDCFKWAVIATLHHEKISNNPQKYVKARAL